MSLVIHKTTGNCEMTVASMNKTRGNRARSRVAGVWCTGYTGHWGPKPNFTSVTDGRELIGPFLG